MSWLDDFLIAIHRIRNPAGVDMPARKALRFGEGFAVSDDPATDAILVLPVGGGTGPQGPQGATGAQGSQGSAGPQGAQGSAGADGAQGAQGADGAQGAQGVAGPQGAGGSAGPQGLQGATGAQGAQGAQGATGTGAQGPQGTQGAQGAQGAQGSGTIGARAFGQGDSIAVASSGWTEIAGYEIVLGASAYVFAWGSTTWTSTNTADAIGLRIVIGPSSDGLVYATTSGNNHHNATATVYRSGLLTAGTYIVSLQAQRFSGAGTLTVSGALSALAL